MSILNTINNLSFKKITGLAFVLGLVLAIPIVITVMQTQTKIGSKAFFEKPKPIIPGKIYGTPSSGDPQITLVWPFIGKIGDAVLIHGDNLGNNPLDKSLVVGNVSVPENEIVRWTPKLIEFNLPQGSQSGPINLRVGDKTSAWDYPFMVYSLDTKTQVTENNDIVKVFKGPVDGTLVIYFNDGSQMESKNFENTKVPSDKTILSISILDKNSQPIPFFVEPEEFGF